MIAANTLLKLSVTIYFIFNSAYAFTSIADGTVKAVAALATQIKHSKNLKPLGDSQKLLLRQIGTSVDDYLPYLNRYSKEDRFRILLAAAEQKDMVKGTEKLSLYRAMLKGKIDELHLINILKIEKMARKNLPVEATETLDLIKKGGSFSHNKDGSVFQNRENKLPIRKDPDYYQEYTVKTPERSDRGARRIITGKNGETYYTEDHYQTFKEIAE